MTADGPPDIVVIAGGEPVSAAAVADILAAVGTFRLIAADSGVDRAHDLALPIDVAVGDFDSVTRAGLERAEDDGAEIVRHPIDKDATDLALALDRALEYAPARVVVIGGHGGRLDHHLANLLLLGADRYAGLEIEDRSGRARLRVVRDRVSLAGRPGELVSLLALHGPATGVCTEGLRWALNGDTLRSGSSRGVSNEFVSPIAVVRLDRGVLYAIQPDAFDPNPPDQIQEQP